MSQKEFAVRMDMSEKHIDKLISGDIQLTSEITAKLEAVLGIPADFWNKREKIYRDKIVKIEAEKLTALTDVKSRQVPSRQSFRNRNSKA